ncbi:MAG: hypothetical protein F6J93_00050 [Oscillatoria sp. SIO1A7]|nr:hypothetical protein [Oscillatoria sp. SIO1A7]
MAINRRSQFGQGERSDVGVIRESPLADIEPMRKSYNIFPPYRFKT